MWNDVQMISTLISALNVFGFVLCIVIGLLTASLWQRSHNPLLLLSGIYSGLGVVFFSLVFYFRQLPGGEFPSVLNGLLVWGFAIIGLMFLFISLIVNLWFPGRWRGR